MSGIILRTNALKIVRGKGGFPTRTRYETRKNDLGVEERIKIHEEYQKRVPGTDYVVFNCPWDGCRARNKQSMYQAKGVVGDLISFRCNRCRREIEVSRPIEKPKSIIIPTIDAPKHVGLFGPDNRPIVR